MLFRSYIDYFKKNLEEKGVDVKSFNVDAEYNFVEFLVGDEEKKYLYFGNYEVNDFIFKREK